MGEKRININCFFMCYLMYILLVLCDEAVNLIFFLLNLPQASISTNIIAVLLFLVIAVFLVRNVFAIQSFHYSPNIIFFSILIFIFGLIKAIYPDLGWDNGNYHLIAQNREFTNWFETGFAVGNFQIYGFRLGDRCYTIFRTLLGYRFGVLISLYAVECSYYLLVDFIDKHLCNFNSPTPNFKYTGFIAFIILFTHDVAALISSYYVDLLAIPLLLEMLKYVLVRKRNTPQDHAYVALLAGLSFAFKMTNIVYIAPIIILYIFQNYRELHCKNFLQCSILCGFPCSIYAIYNYVVTGNPIFPYYNSIFKSPYFHLENWSDKRWGGKTITEKFFWIFYHSFRPDYRQGENVNVHSQLLMAALIFSICTFFILVGVRFIKKEVRSFPFTIYIIFFCCSLIWSFTTGYARYFILGDILLLLMFFVSLFEIHKLISSHICYYIIIVFIGAMLFTPFAEMYDSLNGKDWSGRRIKLDNLAQQIQYVFNDFPSDMQLSQKYFFITESQISGYVYLMNPDAYIFNSQYSVRLDDNQMYLYNTALKNFYNTANNQFFDLKFGSFSDWENYQKTLDNYNLEVVGTTEINTNISSFTLIELQPENMFNVSVEY